jgi:hypothetical protein
MFTEELSGLQFNPAEDPSVTPGFYFRNRPEYSELLYSLDTCNRSGGLASFRFSQREVFQRPVASGQWG